MLTYGRTLNCLLAVLIGACANGSPDTPKPMSVPAETSVTGTLNYREMVALTPDAIAVIKLLDTSLADVAATEIASQSISNPGQVPIKFELPYPSTKIEPGRTYTVRGDIFDRGQRLFTTDTAYRVLARGQDNSAELMLIRIADPQPAAPLESTSWNLVALGSQPIAPVAAAQTPTLLLENGRASGSAGCNRYFGGYTLSSNGIRFGDLGVTAMACPTGMDVERDYLTALASADSFRVAGNDLFMLSDGSVRLRFRRQR